MILYFSGTGNCQYTANRIAADTHDTAVSIEQHDPDIHLKSSEALGFVFPTHFWKVPAIMQEYIQRLSITADSAPYVFAVITFGTTPGCAGTDFKKLLHTRGLLLSAAFSLKMPDNWTPVFDLTDKAKVQKQNDQADKKLSVIIEQIKAQKTGNHTQRRAPYFLCPITDKLYLSARKTTRFTVGQNCIGCELCAQKCPVQAIEMHGHRPRWIKEHCTLCLRCLHFCPSFAIQYGNGKTSLHGQYHHPQSKI